MNKRNVTKNVLGLAIATGVGHIVDEVIKNNVTTNNKAEKIITWFGKTGITWVVVDKTRVSTDYRVDKVADWLISRKDK